MPSRGPSPLPARRSSTRRFRASKFTPDNERFSHGPRACAARFRWPYGTSGRGTVLALVASRRPERVRYMGRLGAENRTMKELAMAARDAYDGQEFDQERVVDHVHEDVPVDGAVRESVAPASRRLVS